MKNRTLMAAVAFATAVAFTAQARAAPVIGAVTAIGSWYASLTVVGQLLVQVAIAAAAFGLEYVLSGSGSRVAAATSDQQIASITPERDGLLTVRRAYGTITTAGGTFSS